MSETPFLRRKEFLSQIRQLKAQVSALKIQSPGGGTGAEYFIQLKDVPDSYQNQADKLVKVKATQDGLTFDEVIDGGTW